MLIQYRFFRLFAFSQEEPRCARYGGYGGSMYGGGGYGGSMYGGGYGGYGGFGSMYGGGSMYGFLP